MIPALTHRVGERLQWLCAYVALWMIGSFIFVAASSLTYPFHLEWMEGHVMDGVARIREGLPLYDKPSIDYISFLYTPYYYYITAFVSLFTGLDFYAGRLVSFAAALGTGYIIYKWLRREECAAAVAITGVGAYYATYIISGRWMDVARVDSLFVFLSLLGLYVFYHYRGWQNGLIASAILCAAYFTKQTAAIAILPALAVMLLLDLRHGLLVASVLIAAIGVFSFIGHVASHGWFSFYVYQLPSMHQLQKHQLIAFWTKDLIPNVGLMMVITACALLHWLRHDWRKGLWYGALAAGFIACSYSGRLNWGGFINVLMPACCMLGMLTGLSLGYLSRLKHPLLAVVLPVLVLAQFCWLFYNPYKYIPTQASVDQGNRFLEEIAKIKGEVLMPEVQFVQRRIGKKSYGLNMGALDIIVTNMKGMNYIKQDLLRELKQSIASGQFGAVLVGGVVPLPELKRHYHFHQKLSYPKEYIYLASGFLRRDLMLPVAQQEKAQ